MRRNFYASALCEGVLESAESAADRQSFLMEITGNQEKVVVQGVFYFLVIWIGKWENAFNLINSSPSYVPAPTKNMKLNWIHGVGQWVLAGHCRTWCLHDCYVHCSPSLAIRLPGLPWMAGGVTVAWTFPGGNFRLLQVGVTEELVKVVYLEEIKKNVPRVRQN